MTKTVRTSTTSTSDYHFRWAVKDIISNGRWDKNPRPKWSDGTPAFSKFTTQVSEKYFDEIPVTSCRSIPWKSAINEILWIYSLQSNKLSDLHDLGIKWWDQFDIGDGTIGNRYGYTVRKYGIIDELLENLKNDPFSRRHIIDLYQYEDLKSGPGLHPCAFMVMFSANEIEGEMELDCTLIQRSSDFLLANHINKFQYYILNQMICGHLGYKSGTFTHFVQNLHIYDRHLNAAEAMVKDLGAAYTQVEFSFNEKPFFEYTVEDFNLKVDAPKPPKLELAV